MLPTSTVYCEGQRYVSKADEVRQVEEFRRKEGARELAQIGRGIRRAMTPAFHLATKSPYWTRGGSLKKILWSDDDAVKSYFIAAGKSLTYANLRRQLSDSLEDKDFPPLPEPLQERMFFEFGSIEDHFKYRDAVRRAYPRGNFPVFEGFNHMQYQIRDPAGFASMLREIMRDGRMPPLPFSR